MYHIQDYKNRNTICPELSSDIFCDTFHMFSRTGSVGVLSIEKAFSHLSLDTQMLKKRAQWTAETSQSMSKLKRRHSVDFNEANSAKI